MRVKVKPPQAPVAIAMTNAAEKKPEFHLMCWYVSEHRVLEHLGSDLWISAGGDRGAVAHCAGRHILHWSKQQKIPSLARLIHDGKLEAGRVFFHDGRFYSKGFTDSRLPVREVRLWYPLKELSPERKDRLEIRFTTSGITTETAWGNLQGQPKVYVVAVVVDVDGETVIANPLAIGQLGIDHGFGNIPYASTSEIHARNFDAFKGVDFGQRVMKADIEILKLVPEQLIKELFAEKMNQPFVPKDWGGETGDLLAANAMVNGKQAATGFIFKGPSKFHPMTLADCGKQGDQIYRFFDYEAECYVLQHCHDVTSPVRKAMFQCAEAKRKPWVRWCIINGYETYAILKHFGKLPGTVSKGKKRLSN